EPGEYASDAVPTVDDPEQVGTGFGRPADEREFAAVARPDRLSSAAAGEPADVLAVRVREPHGSRRASFEEELFSVRRPPVQCASGTPRRAEAPSRHHRQLGPAPDGEITAVRRP